jgi:hypothetical protein
LIRNNPAGYLHWFAPCIVVVHSRIRKVGWMKILIAAIDHGLQLAKDPCDPPGLATQKDQLEIILRRGIQERNVRFISEESDPKKKTVACLLANAAEPSIPWKNIKMSDEKRIAVGIKEALEKRPGHPDYETMTVWIESRIPADIVREGFFIEQTLQAANGADSILMLLGDLHVDAVEERLTKMGHHVETNHDLFPVRRWEEIRDAQ